MAKNQSAEERERVFNENLVEQYLKYGSVDEALRIHRYGIPISYAGYQRVLNRWGIVKAAGPNSKLNEILGFLSHLAEENIPVEKLYRKMPPSFITSAATLYRILAYIKEGVTRRVGTGLIISFYNDDRILMGEDVSTPRIELGKPFGSISIPMGFSRKRDSREAAILRVLQQEVFANDAIKNNMPDIVPVRPKPFMYLDIADVRVEIFHIALPKKISSPRRFSSFKLQNYCFLNLEKFETKKKNNYRAGMFGAIKGYKKYLELRKRNLIVNPLQYKSRLNHQLALVPDHYH